jgi:hypothetical protein
VSAAKSLSATRGEPPVGACSDPMLMSVKSFWL